MTTELLAKSDIVRRAKKLKKSAALSPILEIFNHWLQVLCGLTLFYIHPCWWLYIPVVLFVSARQYGLGVLLHDAQHTLLHPNKTTNQWLARWFLAAPLGVMFTDSQKNHLDHHYHFGSQEFDPDYALYCFGDPSRKQSASQLFLLFGGKLTGRKAIQTLEKVTDTRGPSGTSPDSAELRGRPSRISGLVRRLWGVVFLQALLLVVFTFAFGWYGYFTLWALPIVTLAALYNDFRIFCEHSLIGRDATNPDERMISFISNPLERFFIAPNHMNYHAEHHLFPYVPHRNLPALRDAIRKCPELNDRIEWRASYFGHLKAYINGFKHTTQEPTFSSSDTRADRVTTA